MQQQYKMVLAYEGTAYAGWQSQPEGTGIADVIQKTFARVFDRTIKLIGSSRTDAGVHAYGQVATFSTDLCVPSEKLRYALQNSLPSDIIIRSLEAVLVNFHPRHDVLQKIYWYHIACEQPLPPLQRVVWYNRAQVDLEMIQKTLQLFVGKHDFYAFCADGDNNNTVRTIESIELDWNEQFQAYRIIFKGRSFARHLIRRLIGAAVIAATTGSHASYQDVQRIFEKRQSNNTLPKAPAQGLLLYEIQY